mmetsp:Transcript_17896/g.31381  ORF Transcript_17896/g.31381 Transcript_17896/m.31381 type:complete len:400 (+) Transcript_17896:37-1236(+)
MAPVMAMPQAAENNASVPSLVQIGMQQGLNYLQAMELAQKILSGQVASATTGVANAPSASAPPEAEPGESLFDELEAEAQALPKAPAKAERQEALKRPAPQPEATVAKRAKQEEKDLVKMVTGFRDEFALAVEQHDALPSNQETLDKLEVVRKLYQEKISMLEAMLCQQVKFEPIKDLQLLPYRISVNGFQHHEEFNQEFYIDSNSNVNGKPVYWTSDKQSFMYRTQEDKSWHICPATDPDSEEPDKKLLETVTWGSTHALAYEVEAEQGLWHELDETGSWQEVEIECRPDFYDLREPESPPEPPQENEFVVDKSGFAEDSQIPLVHRSGLCFFKSKDDQRPESRFVNWGQTVHGIEHGSWVQVTDGGYLPVVLRGRRVLTALMDMDPAKLAALSKATH